MSEVRGETLYVCVLRETKLLQPQKARGETFAAFLRTFAAFLRKNIFIVHISRYIKSVICVLTPQPQVSLVIHVPSNLVYKTRRTSFNGKVSYRFSVRSVLHISRSRKLPKYLFNKKSNALPPPMLRPR